MPDLPSRDELGRHLVTARIAGSVRTPVWDVLRKAGLVAAGDPDHCFGLSGMHRYTQAEVLAEVTRQFGWSHTPGEPGDGPTWIEPEPLLDEIDRAAARLARAASAGEHILFATGHPTGMLGLYQQVAVAVREAGAKLSRPGDGLAFQFHEHRRRIIYSGWVAVLASGANLYHTHEAHPMELVLEQATEVDLVVGDHGWAGAAAERGIDVVAVADINDPALPMAKAEGRAGIVLGMDDNVRPDPVGLRPAGRLPAGQDPPVTDRYARLIEQVLDDPGTVLLLGSMDSGKTTFARALLAGAVDRGIPAAYLDTDVGRTTVGPPTTIGLKHVLEAKHLEDDELALADGLYFVGWVSAQFHLLPLIAGTAKLMDVARRAGAELIVVDTSSLISGVYGQILKYHKLEVSRPEYVIGFERGEELEPLLGIARRFTPARVEAYPVHPEARPTTLDERSETRRARFASYFSGNLHRWRVKPTVFLPSLPPEADLASLAGLLVGMEDGKGSCVGIGYLELAEDGHLRMISAVSEGARALRLGSTRITPDWASTTRVDLRHLFGTE